MILDEVLWLRKLNTLEVASAIYTKALLPNMRNNALE